MEMFRFRLNELEDKVNSVGCTVLFIISLQAFVNSVILVGLETLRPGFWNMAVNILWENFKAAFR